MAILNFNRILQWTDFTEVSTPRVAGLTAETWAGFAINFTARDRKPNGMRALRPSAVTVSVGLEPGKSWVLRGSTVPILLRHEQGHHDIAAIAARQCHDEALKIEADSDRTLLAAVDTLARATIALMQQIQKVYDDPGCATAHGANRTMQLEWAVRIAAAKNDPNGRLTALAACLPPILPVLLMAVRHVL
ncbi:MAG TPA: DUF922 domain-containing protein [Gemmataceae bacterium]|nr:DUF922 domain-containing protein [Gemmataceae bacterium]